MDPYPYRNEPPDKNPEVEQSHIDKLPAVLGFVESDELRLLHSKLLEQSGLDSKEIEALITQYRIIAEEVVTKLTGEAYTKAQIGLIIQMAIIKRACGMDFAEDFRDAITYAWNVHLDQIVELLETELQTDS